MAPISKTEAPEGSATKDTTKAWLYSSVEGGLEKHLELRENVPRPPHLHLGEKEMLVEVLSTSLNPADYKVPEMAVARRLLIGTPASPGQDFCGRVVATHNKNDWMKIGRLVFGRRDMPTKHGTLGGFMVVSSAGCVPVPEGGDIDSFAALGTAALTAYQSIVPYIKTSGAQPKIFINGGSGGTGTWGIQIAKAVGAYVTTTCSTANVELCKELGADEVIDYKNEDVCSVLKSHGKVYDLVVDNVGNAAELYKESEHYLKPDGKFVQVGISLSLNGATAMMDRMLRPSFLGGGKRSFSVIAVKNKSEDLEQLGQWLSQGKIKAVIEEKYAFEDAPKAFERLRSGHVKGKLVVHVADQQ